MPYSDVRMRAVRFATEAPLTSRQLGEFLGHVARLRDYATSSHDEVSRRFYPGGGARYELEIYPLVHDVDGLTPGAYHYDPADHVLEHLSDDTPAVRASLAFAGRVATRQSPPPVLLVVTARFGRVAWKYESIAYSLVLKHVGVLYAVMYDTATAMGLSPAPSARATSTTTPRPPTPIRWRSPRSVNSSSAVRQILAPHAEAPRLAGSPQRRSTSRWAGRGSVAMRCVSVRPAAAGSAAEGCGVASSAALRSCRGVRSRGVRSRAVRRPCAGISRSCFQRRESRCVALIVLDRERNRARSQGATTRKGVAFTIPRPMPRWRRPTPRRRVPHHRPAWPVHLPRRLDRSPPPTPAAGPCGWLRRAAAPPHRFGRVRPTTPVAVLGSVHRPAECAPTDPTPDVGVGPDVADSHQLGRAVGQGSGGQLVAARCKPRSCEAEIHQRCPVRRTDADIARLEIEVDQTGVVARPQRRRDTNSAATAACAEGRGRGDRRLRRGRLADTAAGEDAGRPAMASPAALAAHLLYRPLRSRPTASATTEPEVVP